MVTQEHSPEQELLLLQIRVMMAAVTMMMTMHEVLEAGTVLEASGDHLAAAELLAESAAKLATVVATLEAAAVTLVDPAELGHHRVPDLMEVEVEAELVPLLDPEELALLDHLVRRGLEEEDHLDRQVHLDHPGRAVKRKLHHLT
jgi:hypothetical protein